MTRTIEGIVENHRVAAERRAAGKKIWDFTISIKSILHEDQSNESDEHAASVANRIGAVIRTSLPAAWLDWESDKTEEALLEIVEGLEALRPDSYKDVEDFSPLEDLNGMLAGLYDWADAKRVWIN